MKQEEELRKIKAQIKKNQQIYKSKALELDKLKKKVEVANSIKERYGLILKDIAANPQTQSIIQQYIKNNPVPKDFKHIFE